MCVCVCVCVCVSMFLSHLGALWSDKNPYSTEKSPSSSDSDDNQQDNPQTITSKNSNPQRTQTSGSHPLPVEGQLRAVHLITTKKAKEHLVNLLKFMTSSVSVIVILCIDKSLRLQSGHDPEE